MTKRKPRTPREWALYRCALSCKAGRDALNSGVTPEGTPVIEYALFTLLHAVEEIGKAMEHDTDRTDAGI
jgi:hypothetical protein